MSFQNEYIKTKSIVSLNFKTLIPVVLNLNHETFSLYSPRSPHTAAESRHQPQSATGGQDDRAARPLLQPPHPHPPPPGGRGLGRLQVVQPAVETELRLRPLCIHLTGKVTLSIFCRYL